MTAQISNAIILSSQIGSSPPIYGYDRDIPAGDEFTKGKVDGSDSFYIVYSKPDFNDDSTTTPQDSTIVNSTDNVDLGFTARSTQGWDKVGITVLEHYWYGGTGHTYITSNPDITPEFPPEKREGASSFIVMKGVWSLYTEKNYNGIKITIDGKDEFGPGDKVPEIGAASDRVLSIEYVRDD